MTWVATITNKSVSSADGSVYVFATYADNSDPATVLATQAFTFSSQSTADEVQTAISHAGVTLQTLVTQGQALVDQIPGTVTVTG